MQRDERPRTPTPPPPSNGRGGLLRQATSPALPCGAQAGAAPPAGSVAAAQNDRRVCTLISRGSPIFTCSALPLLEL